MSTYSAALANGVTASTGYGQWERLTFSTGWAAGDTYSFAFADTRPGTTVGAQYITSLTPTFALTLNRRVFFAAGRSVYFSANDDATGFINTRDVGANYFNVSDRFNSPENVVALASYQGRMAIFNRRSIQIELIDADPSQFAQSQILQNIGTMAPLSVQSIGDMDVFFLSDTGVRSLRVRDSSLNALVADVGSPTDLYIQTLLTAYPSEAATACGIVEPTSNRYWLFLHDTIFVLSYFPSSKIAAWSTYQPTYDVGGVQTRFTPEKFIVSAGVVYCRDTTGKIFQYSTTLFDNCVATVRLPWLDAKKPGHRKDINQLDVSMQGVWNVKASADYLSNPNVNPGNWVDVITADKPTFDMGRVGFTATGTHFSLLATTSDDQGYLKEDGSRVGATMSGLLVYYGAQDEK